MKTACSVRSTGQSLSVLGSKNAAGTKLRKFRPERAFPSVQFRSPASHNIDPRLVFAYFRYGRTLRRDHYITVPQFSLAVPNVVPEHATWGPKRLVFVAIVSLVFSSLAAPRVHIRTKMRKIVSSEEFTQAVEPLHTNKTKFDVARK